MFSPIAMQPIKLFSHFAFSILFPMFWFLAIVWGGLVEWDLLDILKVFLSFAYSI